MTEPSNVAHRPRLVIVGAGFGGLTAAKSLADAPIDITVIDQHNHHLFQPLLYQVATGSFAQAEPSAKEVERRAKLAREAT